MGSTLIFWKTEIAPFMASNGMKVTPIQCSLTTGENGYWLGSVWKEEIEARGVVTSPINKSDIINNETI